MSAAQDPFVGTTLGKFKIEKKLGQGGMGAVYKARDNLGRTVALKLLPAHFAAQPEWVERFHREASRAALLNHPNIVQVFECDTTANGHHYISMQFMEGGSLEGVIQKRGPLPPLEAARLVRDAARGLARAHQDGVIHRDIKPANILLGADGEVRLGDFGLVKSTRGDDQPLTQTGMVLGTPHYMAPEQCEGLPDVDGRADLYALGIVLYQALSNVLPVKGSTPLQIIRHRTMEDPPPLAQVAPRVPAPLARIVDELLVRDRDRRLGSAPDLVARLDAFVETQGNPTQALTLGGAPTAAAGSVATLPPIDVPPAVPTGKLVRYDRSEVVPPDAGLPELPSDLVKPPTPRREPPPPTPPPTPPRRDPPPPRRDPAPPPQRPPVKRRSSWTCWFLTCGTLFVVGMCLLGGLLAKRAEEEAEQEYRRQQEAYEEQQRQQQELLQHHTQQTVDVDTHWLLSNELQLLQQQLGGTKDPYERAELQARIDRIRAELGLAPGDPWSPGEPPPPPDKGKGKRPW